VLVQRSVLLYVLLQFYSKRLRCGKAFVEYDCCLNELTALLIGNAGDCTFKNSRMCLQDAFHFKRRNAVSTRLDDVIVAAYEPEVTVIIKVSGVSGVIESAVKCGGGERHVVIISCKQTKWPAVIKVDHYFASFARLAGSAIFFDNRNIVSRSRLTHRAGFDFHTRKIPNKNGAFRLTVCFVHLKTCLFQKAVENFRIECFSGSHRILQR